MDQQTKCKSKNIKLTEENTEINLHHLRFGKGILIMVTKEQQQQKKK